MTFPAILQDATFWVAISFVIFMVLAYTFGRHRALSALDVKIIEIKNKIESAEILHREAAQLLAEYEVKKASIETQSGTIIADAKAQAEAVRKDAEKALNETILRKEQQLQERLKRIEEGTMEEMRSRAAQIALEAAAEIMRQNVNEQAHNRMVDATIQALPQQMSRAA